MTMYLENRDKKFVGALTVILSLISLMLWPVLGERALVLLVVVVTSVAIAVQIEIYRRIAQSFQESFQIQLRAQSQFYRQVESLFSLFSLLRLNSPLPPMRNWAISPDFANLIVAIVRERKPKLILELGSGVSTLVTAYTLKEIGRGTVVSLDHDKEFARVTVDNVRKHGLIDIANVICSPLREVVIHGRKHQWYDTVQLEGLDAIDMLIVDGPPGDLQEMARYPALPLLWKRLREDAVILIDDAMRADEKKMIELWRGEFRNLHSEPADTENGAVVLRRTKEPTSTNSRTQVSDAAIFRNPSGVGEEEKTERTAG